MTIASEIQRLQWAKASARASIISKWVNVPVNASVEDYHTYIDMIESGMNGIFYDENNWDIYMFYNWSYIAIQDKNVWATAVYDYWDTVSASNAWKFFQRWNNYWFSYTWTVTTTTARSNLSSYWPWNYYSNSSFYKSTTNSDRDTSGNYNLWWYETWTEEAMRWPCDSGYHIPSPSDLRLMRDILSWLWLIAQPDVALISKLLHLPYTWYRYRWDWSRNEQWDAATYWGCFHDENISNAQLWEISKKYGTVSFTSSYWVANAWFMIRGFKNLGLN